MTRALGPELRAQYALPLVLSLVVWAVTNLSLDTASGRLLARREASLTEITRLLSSATLVLGTGGALIALGIGLAVREDLLSGASTTAVGLACLMVPANLVVQLAIGLLIRLGALHS
ncbi:MAG TPA: hypothetical protein VD931_20195, partial [Baekduia sp.]|nr:hypothetical protein [Baekduia sp.]